MPTEQAHRLVAQAASAPYADPEVSYPEWYLHRWHFLPEGYLSERSAALYDRVIRVVYNATREAVIANDIVRMVSDLGAASVLEVGSGPGRLLARLFSESGAQRIVGVDLSPYLLALARDRAGEDVVLLHGTGLELPTRAESFDVAVACHYVGHLPSDVKSTAVAQLASAVREGGSVIIVDHRWHAWPDHRQLRLRDEIRHAFGTILLRRFEKVAA